MENTKPKQRPAKQGQRSQKKNTQNEKDFYNYILRGSKKFNCTIIPTLEISIGTMPVELSIPDLFMKHKINIRTKSN